MLMLSGVLKQVVDADPGRGFNLVRRTNYLAVLGGHPAIDKVGYPPKGAKFERVDYWSMEKLGPGDKRPYQVLARGFGLATPVEETMYLAEPAPPSSVLLDFIPWKSRNVLIAPASDSPRKAMPPEIWHELVRLLRAEGMLVIQGGRLNEIHIRNAYSVQGLTRPKEYIELVRRCDLVISSDSFAMHAAHLTGTRTLALWGATNHLVYGYPEQKHIQYQKSCELGEYDDCIGPERNKGGSLYGTECPLKEKHCLGKARPAEVFEAARAAMAGP